MNISDNNSVWNVLDNETQAVIIETIDTASQVVNALICGFTVLLNSVVIVCLKTRRRKIPDTIWYQLLNLTIGDLVSGICFGLLCLTLISPVNTHTVTCITIVLLLSTSQSATSLNLCILSVKRWTIIRKLTQPSAPARGNMYSVLCSWVISLLCHLPILGFVTKSPHVNGCLSVDILDMPNILSIGPLMNILALLVTNCVYGHSISLLSKRNTSGIQLKKEKQLRTDAGHKETNFEDSKDFQENVNRSTCSRQPIEIGKGNLTSPSNKPKPMRTGIHKKSKMEQNTATSKFHLNANNRKGKSTSTQTQTGARPFPNVKPSYPISTNTNSNRVDGCKSSASETEGEHLTLDSQHDDTATCSVSRIRISVISSTTPSSRQVETSSRTISMPRTGAAANMTQRCHEKRAIKLLLTVLTTVNIATLSYIAIGICFVVGVFKVDSSRSFVLDWQILALNSLLNPVVYSFQVTQIRAALKEDFVRLWRLVTGQRSS